MKKLALIFLVLFVCARPALASLHLISRETFRGVGTLTSATPDKLGTVTGSFYQRPVGPRLVGDTSVNGLGWSADFHHASEVTSTLPLAPPTGYQSPPADMQCFDCWVYVSDYALSGNTEVLLAYLEGDEKSTPLFAASLGSTSGAISLTTYQYDGAPRTSVKLNLDTWYEVRLAWSLDANEFYSYDVSVLYRTVGAKSFTTLHHYSNVAVFGPLDAVVSGSYSLDGSSSFNGRIGMPSLYTLDSFSDCTTLVNDVVDPPSGPFNWYVNPVTGNDHHDGTTPGTAWRSVAKVNAESQYCGMFPSTRGYAYGDTLNINGATGPGAGLVLGTASLQLSTQGLNLIGHDSPYSYIQAEEVMAEQWKPVSGSGTIWQCTLSTVDPSSYMWEDDKWLNHPTGTAFAGAVATAMAATPGSFWTDGTTMYYRPFVASNPNTDGKVKTRSYNRGGAGNSAILMLAPQLHLQGIKCRKTALADEDTNDPVNAYCLQSLGNLNGVSMINNDYFDYGSKHIIGFTDTSTNRAFTVRDTTVDQCQPYGGGTPLVDYCSLTGPLTNTTSYLGVDNPHVLGLIGSSEGNPVNGTNATWYSHSGGVGDFSNITMRSCNFAGYVESTEAESSMSLTEMSCGAIISSLAGTGTMTVDRCKITVAGIVSSNVNGQTVVTNSLIIPSQPPYTGALEYSLQGNISFKGCTFDLSKLTTTGPNAFYTRSAPLDLTMENCLILLNPANGNLGFLSGGKTVDRFALDHNLYQTAKNAGTIFSLYDDGITNVNRSLSQLIALKIEQKTSHDEAPFLHGNYLPEDNSPAILAGVNLNPPTGTDFSGTAFAVRATLGAFEPEEPVIATQPSAQAPVVGQTATFSVQATAETGITYQWEKNGVNIPGATASTLSIPEVTAADQGLYSVTLTNSYGSVTSAPASLLPVTAQPLRALLSSTDQSRTFTIQPAGVGPFTYQWTKDGNPLPGATGHTYTIAEVTPADYGVYSVLVTANGIVYSAGPYDLDEPLTAPTLPTWGLVLLSGLLLYLGARNHRSSRA